MATILEARDAGIIRHIGFSAHSEDAALALLDRFPFESLMTPINWACWHGGGYGPRIVARVRELDIGLLALKTLALRKRTDDEERTWPKCWYMPVDMMEEAIPAARFTLSQPVTTAISPSHAELLWLLCDAAEQFQPITPTEDAALAERARTLATIFPVA
jgi:aryl-alcohol dehydrogenase-like predicted oxidoreductase